MRNETPIIERLENMSQLVELMLERPSQFARSPEALETGLYVAMVQWGYIIDSPLDVKTLWREEVVNAYPKSAGYASVSLANPKAEDGSAIAPDINNPEPRQVWQNRITYHMRRVWEQLKHTGSTVKEVSDEDDDL
jgi:hypothetical protein